MRTFLITGSTDGIGKLAAIKLVKDGHHVLLHGRNKSKLTAAESELKAVSKTADVRGYVCDLSDFESIKDWLAQLHEENQKIDVLINNAGVFHSKDERNNSNLDMRFVVNFFAPFILTNGLLPLLKSSDSARVINLSSAAQAPVSLEVLRGEKMVTAQNAYAQSKLALTMWSFFFAERHPEINTIAVNPGSLLNTKMVQEAFGQHWDSADKGAKILSELATESRYSDSSGKYFDNDLGDFNKAHADAYDQKLINALITQTEQVLISK